MTNSTQVSTEEYKILLESYKKLEGKCKSLEKKEFADYYSYEDNQEIIKMEKELKEKHSRELIKSRNSGWLDGINELSKLQKEKIEEIIEMSYNQGFNDCKDGMFYSFTQHIGWGNYRKHWGKMSDSYGENFIKKKKIPVIKKDFKKRLKKRSLQKQTLPDVAPDMSRDLLMCLL